MVANLTEEQWKPIDAEIFTGRKIRAIKLYREVTGAGLKDAKDVIDERDAALRNSLPSSFQTPARTGCLGVILLAVGLFVSFKSFS